MIYASNSSSALAAGKSRNNGVTSATSQGSLGTKYKSSSKPVGYAMSPKAVGMMTRDSQNKLKYGMKGSPKQQTSPSGARMAPSLSSQGGVFSNDAGRNMSNAIRTKHSLGATSDSSGINYLRTSGTNSS